MAFAPLFFLSDWNEYEYERVSLSVNAFQYVILNIFLLTQEKSIFISDFLTYAVLQIGLHCTACKSLPHRKM